MTSRDIPARPILWFAASMVVLIGGCILASWAVLRVGARTAANAIQQPELLSALPSRPSPPKTRLQVTPQADLAAYAREKAQVLRSYAWVDRSAGQVRIPIEAAIELAAQRGLPAFAPPTQKEP